MNQYYLPDLSTNGEMQVSMGKLLSQIFNHFVPNVMDLGVKNNQ